MALLLMLLREGYPLHLLRGTTLQVVRITISVVFNTGQGQAANPQSFCMVTNSRTGHMCVIKHVVRWYKISRESHQALRLQ